MSIPDLPSFPQVPDGGAAHLPHTRALEEALRDLHGYAATLPSADDLADLASLVTPQIGSWTPALVSSGTAPTLGAGSTQQGRYVRIVDLVHVWVTIQFGTSGAAAGSGIYAVTLPFDADPTRHVVGDTVGAVSAIGSGSIRDDSDTDATQTIVPYLVNPGLVRLATEQNQVRRVTSSAPFTWAASDGISFVATYLADPAGGS